MLFVVKPGKENKLIDEFTKWGLQVAVIGKVLKEKVVRVLHNGQIAAEIPADALAEDTPVENHVLIKETPNHIKANWIWTEKLLPKCSFEGIQPLTGKFKDKFLSWNKVILNLLDYPLIASKRWIYQQYDYQVQSNSVVYPGMADAAVIRLRPQEGDQSLKESNKGIAAVVDCPNRWVFLDPLRGSIAAVAEAARNLSCVGAEPLAVTDNLNFASPENPLGYWQLAMACKGISFACEALNTPITGGNVSLYNETRKPNGDLEPIQPTPVIGMVGLIDNLNKTKTQSWKNPDDIIYLLGVPFEINNQPQDSLTLGATSYLEVIHDVISGRPPKINLAFEKSIQEFLRESIEKGFIQSAHDVSDGGFAVSLTECSISSGLGSFIEIPENSGRIDHFLFSEGGSRIIVSISSHLLKEWEDFLKQKMELKPNLIYASKIGKVKSSSRVVINHSNSKIIDLSVNELKSVYENSIPIRVDKKNEF